MSGSKTHSWKILALGKGQTAAEKIEKHLHEIGYPNVKVMGAENDKASDDKLIEILKQDDWEGVSIGK